MLWVKLLRIYIRKFNVARNGFFCYANIEYGNVQRKTLFRIAAFRYHRRLVQSLLIVVFLYIILGIEHTLSFVNYVDLMNNVLAIYPSVYFVSRTLWLNTSN